MKKIFILFLFIGIGFTSSVSAQETVSSSSEKIKLTGMWQMCKVEIVDGKLHAQYLPSLKMLDTDGTFYNVQMQTGQQGCCLTAFGSFQITSDSTYVEKVTSSTAYPPISGKEVVINYRILDNEWVGITFSFPGETKRWKEIWKRVKMPVPTSNKK